MHAHGIGHRHGHDQGIFVHPAFFNGAPDGKARPGACGAPLAARKARLFGNFPRKAHFGRFAGGDEPCRQTIPEPGVNLLGEAAAAHEDATVFKRPHGIDAARCHAEKPKETAFGARDDC